MTRDQAQLVRLLLICAAWAAGQVIVLASSLAGLDLIVPAALAIGVYLLTDGLGRPPFDRGDGKYWRGRRVDEDRPGRDRLN